MVDYNTDMKRKKILLITSMYPLLDKDYEGTKVCHYFATEWQKMGYEIRVIRLTTYFPRIVYFIGDLFKEKIKAKTGAVVYTKRLSKYHRYIIDGISVLLTPVYKVIPHWVPSEGRLKHILNISFDDLKSEGFIPDIITAHFQNPQLMAVHISKNVFPNAKTCMVMHNDGSELRGLYKENLDEYMQSVDTWGFRSFAFRKGFENIYGKQKKTFVCYSGIPVSYIANKPKEFSSGFNKFVFLGSLYELKRVNDTIQALAKVYKDKDFEFNIIGDGAEMSSLKALSSSLLVDDRVHFLGRKNRDEAQRIVSLSDIFIMVSAHEAFGLVYIEAMAKGCIVIGTKGQGIDGIIEHGKNGFLCDSENPEALACLINQIITMPKKEIAMVSLNALKTAQSMTNEKAAENYLNNIDY